MFVWSISHQGIFVLNLCYFCAWMKEYILSHNIFLLFISFVWNWIKEERYNYICIWTLFDQKSISNELFMLSCVHMAMVMYSSLSELWHYFVYLLVIDLCFEKMILISITYQLYGRVINFETVCLELVFDSLNLWIWSHMIYELRLIWLYGNTLFCDVCIYPLPFLKLINLSHNLPVVTVIYTIQFV